MAEKKKDTKDADLENKPATDKKSKQGKKGKGKDSKVKEKGKKKAKTGPNKFFLFLATVILALIMLWVLGVVDFATLLQGKAATPAEEKIENVDPTGSAPVTFSSIQVEDQVFSVSPEAAKLAKIYSDMRPQKAAEALTLMPVEEAVPIVAAMDEWRAGIIMSKMDAAKAVEISQLVAENFRKDITTAGGVSVVQ